MASYRVLSCVLKTIENGSLLHMFYLLTLSATVDIGCLRSLNDRRKYLIILEKMFYSHELLSLRQKGKLARCWLAATVSDKIFKRMCKSSTVNGINLCDLCKEIIKIIQIKSDETNRRFSLYLSSQLMYGAVKILSYQTTNLQNQVFQMDKQGSYKISQTYNFQNPSADLELCNVTSVIKDYNIVKLNSSLPLLQDKSNIDNQMEVMMHDATCLDFGALTHEQFTFLYPNDEDISLKVFERMHITNPNLDEELNDVFSDNERILTHLERSDSLMHKNEIEISMSPIHDDISADQEQQVTFANTFAKGMLPQVTMQEIESVKSDVLTPQKRQLEKEKHIETPSKRRCLRFEEAAYRDEIVTAPMAGIEIASVSTTDHPLKLLPDLELVQEDSLQMEKKSQKKKVLADKTTKLSHKTIRKWLNNVSGQTVPLTIINVNMPMSDILLKAPSTSFSSIHEKKWNNSLNAFFHMHTVALYGKKAMQIEYGQLLEKSTEFTRFEDKSNKTEELLSELSSALGKSTELSKNITSEKSITIAIDEFPKVIKADDIMESTLDVPEIVQSPEVTKDTFIPDTSHNSSKSLPPCLVTKQELLVLLEIVWQNTNFAAFNDIISPDHYNKLDAASCFTILLELYKEKKIILKQDVPYDIIWIQKYA